MAWVVDTCVLIDVLEDDPSFGVSSAEALDTHATEGLVICPISYAELAPAFQGDKALQDEFLAGIGVDYLQDWGWEDTVRAHQAWNEHVRRRRAREVAKRPLADILIGAFATRFQGLLTRNPSDFAPVFPGLDLPPVSSAEEKSEG
ncbi:MAG TPA: type II toxin-antitoxin system VapC family toxin [Thermoanaerobaculia bacterium]|jgi:predicted nucleic acid-binding protein|nr:type II toxin-antitoxin system VapC family toxin [Thermoanaerobaculia bacterium]